MDVYLSLVICSVLATFASGAPSLKSYYIDPSGISVSGFSSGGSFASQLHLAHSANISGAGIFAAIPYTCYELYGQNVCRYEPASVDVEQLILAAYALAGENYIDSVDNVTDSKVFLFQGTEDDTVFPRSIVNMLAFYNGLGADVSTELRYAGHGFPTKNYGVSCATTEYPYLNNCGYYAAYELLNHIYGNLEVPADDIKLRGTSGEFDQNEFAGRAFSFNEDGGFIYIPSGCTERVDRKYTEDDVCMIEPSEREECGFSGITEDQCTTGRGCCWTQDPPFFCYQPVRTYEECKLHVVFHGCEMGREYLQNEFYQNAGYLEVAEQNNIIVVFPQIDAKIENVNGCWDWWGYEDIDYAVKSGPQISAVWNMIRKLVGDSN